MSIRKSILAPEGHLLVAADLAQIECRVLNWLAGQEDVLNAFRAGRDLYCEAASRFYQRTITKADKVERQIFKAVELGCGYGMGAKKFAIYAKAANSPVTDATAEELIKFYRHTHEQVCRYWRQADRVLTDMTNPHTDYMWGPIRVTFEKLTYPNGGYSVYHDLHKNEDNEWYYISRGRSIKVYGALVVENVVQALSRVILSQAALKLAKYFKIVNLVHDEIQFICRQEDLDKATACGKLIMTTNQEWSVRLPLDCEIK